MQRGAVEQLGNDLRDDPAVLHRVAEPRGCLHAIGDDPPLAVAVAPEIGGAEQQGVRVGGSGSGDRPDVAGVPQHCRCRQDAFAQHPALAVDVHEQSVEEFGALRESDIELGPVAAVEHEGHGIQAPRLGFGVGRVVGHAVIGQECPDFAVQSRQVVDGEGECSGGHRAPRGSQRAVGCDDLVEARRGSPG